MSPYFYYFFSFNIVFLKDIYSDFSTSYSLLFINYFITINYTESPYVYKFEYLIFKIFQISFNLFSLINQSKLFFKLFIFFILNFFNLFSSIGLHCPIAFINYPLKTFIYSTNIPNKFF